MFDRVNGEALTISINDFSTLYTLFDHDHLLGNISWLLQRLSKNSGTYFIRVSYNKAWWVRDNSVGNVYSVVEVLDMVDYLVRNTYIKALGSIFRQDKGIIMGGKSSGWLSDCSLMVDEFKYIEGKVKSGLVNEALRLKFFSRYRDDCTTVNVDDFLTISAEIYPASLSLTQENEDFSKANVLDMEVSISNGIINTKVYCKTDYFPFDVISLPFLSSNLDNGICYRVFYGQIIRFQRLTSDRRDFEVRTRSLADILIARGYNKNRLRNQFSKAINKYMMEFYKWDIPLDLQLWFDKILSELSS